MAWATGVSSVRAGTLTLDIGRSRGGLTSKIDNAVDGHGRPLAVLVTPGRCHEGQTLNTLLADIWVPRTAAGSPRTRPDLVIGDKAYSSKTTRARLRKRGIGAVIAEPADQ